MKAIGFMKSTALVLLLGMAIPAYAWQERQEKQEKQAEPAKTEKQPEAKPAKQEPEAKPQHAQQPAKPQQEKQQNEPQAKTEKQPTQKSQQQAKTPQEKQQKQTTAAKQPQPKANEQANGSSQANSSHAPQRTQRATATQHAQPELRLSSRGSGRIPDDRFRSNFGRGHEFRMGNPVMVSGYSRFQYGGYWFGYVQSWPSDWYYTDQFYIDYVDGAYYMYNPYYPGARFELTVVL